MEHPQNGSKILPKILNSFLKLFTLVPGLKAEMTDEEIKTHFEQYGTILEFELPFDKTKNARKGFGFITFEREETMKDLIKKGKEKIGEHEIDLKKATPKADFGGGYGGGDWGMGGGYVSHCVHSYLIPFEEDVSNFLIFCSTDMC